MHQAEKWKSWSVLFSSQTCLFSNLNNLNLEIVQLWYGLKSEDSVVLLCIYIRWLAV